MPLPRHRQHVVERHGHVRDDDLHSCPPISVLRAPDLRFMRSAAVREELPVASRSSAWLVRATAPHLPADPQHRGCRRPAPGRRFQAGSRLRWRTGIRSAVAARTPIRITLRWSEGRPVGGHANDDRVVAGQHEVNGDDPARPVPAAVKISIDWKPWSPIVRAARRPIVDGSARQDTGRIYK